MTHVCPKPCGRLATAAVFIAVGVVQLLVGVILLRSKYADLLSGPDFMTAATNIIVGCLYGIAASVWKSNRKRITVKRTARKNVLAALLVSVITVNITASIVLLMCEGNNLLTLEYFGGDSEHSSAAFAKEVLASAYVASVCSPIVCLVVALVALSGNCFRMSRLENKPQSDNSIKKVENAFGWVYERKANSAAGDLVESSSSSNPESSSSEDSVFSNADSISVKRKPFSSIKNIPSPVHTWRHKRAAILKNDSLSRKRTLFDECLQNSELLDRSREGLIPRIKKSSLIKKQSMKNEATTVNTPQSNKNGRWSKDIVPNSGLGQERLDEKDIKKVRNDSYTSAILEGNRINHEERLVRKCISMVSRGVGTADEVMAPKYFSDESPEHFRQHRPSFDGSTRDANVRVRNDRLERSEIVQDEYSEDQEISRLRQMTLKELKKRVHRSMPETNREDFDLPKEESDSNHKAKYDKSSPNTDHENSEERLYLKENVSPDIVFEPRSNSNPKEVEETSVKRVYYEESPVFKPTASSSLKHPKPLDLSGSRMRHSETDAGRGILETKTLYYSNGYADSKHPKTAERVPTCDKKCKLVETYPSVSSMKMHKKRESARKMASIAEIPTEEASGGPNLDRSLPATFSRRTTSFDEKLKNLDENYNIQPDSPSRRLPSESTVRRNSTSFSPKSILKKMWSSAGSDTKLDVSDLIVDEDSLIGLSEDDLIARTLRIRSLRKAVEERLKSERSSQ